MLIKTRPAWDDLRDSQATAQNVFVRRRTLLRGGLGAVAGSLLLPSIGCAEPGKPLANAPKYPWPYKRNKKYELDRPLTDANIATSFNNFYEFSLDKRGVWPLAQKLTTDPWTVQLKGCKQKGNHDLDKLLKRFPHEERLYRFRCVETWAMAVPWLGIPMAAFIKWAEPLAKMKYVRFVSFLRPDQAPGQQNGPYKAVFPYYEGLRLDEATNELALLGTGMYGKQGPKQNGAPLRVIAPWKYGYKSAKSIVSIEFVEKQPPTFWNDLAPNEYGFYSNVNPKVPHPRWSQAREWMITKELDNTKRRPTLLYNGYGKQVAQLYAKAKKTAKKKG